MKLQELSNEEIVFTYLVIDDMLSGMKEIIDDGGMAASVDSPFGPISLFMKLDEESLNAIAGGEKYKMLNALFDKLDPVVNMIDEVQPDLIEDTKKFLYWKKDEGEEEDM